MDVDDMEAVKIHPSIRLPALSARYTNDQVFQKTFREDKSIEIVLCRRESVWKKRTVTHIGKDEDAVQLIVLASNSDTSRDVLVGNKKLNAAILSICNIDA